MRTGGHARGAVLVQVAVAVVGLLAASAFVIDFGMLWTSRREAQNAADAAAMAAAMSLAFASPNDESAARASALTMARHHPVFGATPDITASDVTFPVCPSGAPGAGTATCVRVDVFRNGRPGGSPLPTVFATLAGVTGQGVRATATAQVLALASASCVKPFAIPDKWLERRNDSPPAGWDTSDSFERYVPNGSNAGALLSPADVYVRPSASDPGTGYTRESVHLGGDYGRQVVIKNGSTGQSLSPGWYLPVVINAAEGPGGSNYRDNIATCDPTVIRPGMELQLEPGSMSGPTRQGVEALIAQDPGARWDPNAAGGRGGITGGCMAPGASPSCVLSPRLVAIPVFDPDRYDAARASGRTVVSVVKVLGLFVEGLRGDDVVGRLMSYPGEPRSPGPLTDSAAFVLSTTLVR